MQREVIDKYPTIKKIHPRFKWIKCDICGKEIRFEDMWEVWHRPTLKMQNIIAFRKRCCMTCCPTEKELMIKTKPFDFPSKKP